ncbi:hypothetical protein [Stackebrandtia albiflava]|nr:hypothetical protein [Stackebrandtia albiflava]
MTSRPDPAERPRQLVAGQWTAIGAAAATVLHCVCLLWSYFALTGDGAVHASGEDIARAGAGFAVILAFPFLLAGGLATGAVMLRAGRPAGRVVVWSTGGVLLGWHLPCGMYGTVLLLTLYGTDGDDGAGSAWRWLFDTGVIAGVGACVALVVAIILIALTPVNQYFARLRPPPPPRFGPPPPRYGPPAPDADHPVTSVPMDSPWAPPRPGRPNPPVPETAEATHWPPTPPR